MARGVGPNAATPNVSTPAAVAATAVELYGITDGYLARLGGLDTINYRVDTSEAGRYLLRLHDPSRHQRASIASELVWLAHLAADTRLVVPRPVRNRFGQTVTMVEAGAGPAMACTLMRWVEGESLNGAMTDAHARQAGVVMARLHASPFTPPPGFARQTYDAAYFLRCLTVIVEAFANDLSRDHGRALERGTAALAAFVSRLPRTPATFGLIHADFHQGNYVLHGDELRVIDFGRCAFGHHAFDIATALELDAAQREAFLAGYAAIRPVPPELERHGDAFTCMTYLDNLGFLATRAEERTYVLATLPAVADALGRYADHQAG